MDVKSLKEKFNKREESLKKECSIILQKATLKEAPVILKEEFIQKMGNASLKNGLMLDIESLKDLGYDIAHDESEDMITINDKYNVVIKCKQVYYMAMSDELKFKILLEFEIASPVIKARIKSSTKILDSTIMASSYFTFISTVLVTSMTNPNIYCQKSFDYTKDIKREIEKSVYHSVPKRFFRAVDMDSFELLKVYKIANSKEECILKSDFKNLPIIIPIDGKEQIVLEKISQFDEDNALNKIPITTYLNDKPLEVGYIDKGTINRLVLEITYKNEKIDKKLGLLIILDPGLSKFTLKDVHLEFKPEYWINNFSYTI